MLEKIVKIADQQIEISKFIKEHNGETTSNALDAHDGKLLLKMFPDRINESRNFI